MSEIIEKNFIRLAESIGPHAAIVRGHERSRWQEDLANELWERSDLHNKVGWHAYDAGPGLLILDAHPNEMDTDSLILYVPLNSIEKKFKNFDIFFDSLTKFAKDKDYSFLERFQEEKSFTKEALNYIDINPKIFGIGLNINKVIRKFY